MPKEFQKNQAGFTLIELLTTIAIIGLLATLAMIAVGVARERAKISNAQHDIDQIFKALTLMHNDTGQWPGHQAINQACAPTCAANNEFCGPDLAGQDCVGKGMGDASAGLLLNDTTTPYPQWSGPYLKDYLLTDPWGREYFFDTDYSVDAGEMPCGCDGIPAACHDVAVIGSYGPDGLGKPISGGSGAYGCDDVILVVGR
jgi:prepilin-type N-terminal cleavage/methylation domain-containing protein